MKPDDGRPLAPSWATAVQVIGGLVMLVGFGASAFSDGKWFNWMGLGAALLVLGSVGFEIRRVICLAFLGH